MPSRPRLGSVTRRLGTVLAVSLLFAACGGGSSRVADDTAHAIATAPPGSTLHLTPGRHDGPIVIDRPLTIIGDPGAVIAAPPGEPAVTISRTQDVTLRDVTVVGGESGISVLGSVGVSIERVEIRSAQWQGIYAIDAEIDVTDCLVTGLSASRPQGIEIIRSDRRPPSTIAGCRIEGPVFEGIVARASHVTFEDNDVHGSSPRGISATEGSTARIRGNRVSDATGVAYFCGDQSVCSVVDNVADRVASGNVAFQSDMGHGLVIDTGSVAYVDELRVDAADGESIFSMPDSTLSPEPMSLGFINDGIPWPGLLAVMIVLVLAVVGGRATSRFEDSAPDRPMSKPQMPAPEIGSETGVAVLTPGKRSRNPFDPHTTLGRKRIVGGLIFVALFVAFFGFNRFPKLDVVREDVDIVTAGADITERSYVTFGGESIGEAPEIQAAVLEAAGPGECFQGYCIEAIPGESLVDRWLGFSVTYLWLVTIGMVFAFLVAGLTTTFFFPDSEVGGFRGEGLQGSLHGLTVGPLMTLCSACIVPVANSFKRRGASVSSTIAITQGSSTLNAPAILMTVAIFSPVLAGARIALSAIGAVMLGPFVGWAAGTGAGAKDADRPLLHEPPVAPTSWGSVARHGLVDWLRSAVRFFFRLTPVMIVAGFASGLAIQWLTPGTVSQYMGNHVLGIVLAATFGILINVPLMFEIPLVAGLLLVGMGMAPAATLLFTAAAAGPITFWGLGKSIPARGIAAFAAATWILGVAGGLVVLGLRAASLA